MTDGNDTELSRALLALRLDAGLRQIDVDVVTQTQLSRIEHGKAIPTEEQTRRLAQLYRADKDRIAELVALARDAGAGLRDSRLVVQRGNTLALQQRWSRIEREATVIRAYQPAVVLGVLQSPAYAAVALRHPVDSDVVRSRLERHARLLSEPGRQHLLIQTEAVLRQTVGSPVVMLEQLDAILRASDAPNVEVGIIASSTSLPFLVGSGFHLYDDTAAVIGLEIAAARLTEPADLAHLRGMWDRLAALASWGDEARAVLEQVRGWYR